LGNITLMETIRRRLDDVVKEQPIDRFGVYAKMTELLGVIHGICRCFNDVGDPISMAKVFPNTTHLQIVVSAISEAAKMLMTSWEITYQSAEENHPELVAAIEALVFRSADPRVNDVRLS